MLPLLAACAHEAVDPLAATRAFSATRPVYEQPLADGLEAPAGLGLLAKDCGACHVDAYAEWRSSTHAHAWTDRQLQEEMKKSENRWLCQNCHTPLLRQQARWPVGLDGEDVEKPRWVDNPAPDAALQAEGVTCVACHLRDGVIVGATGVSTPAHPTRADATFRSADLCLRCHQAVATYPGKTFTCTFRTGEEWAAGAFAGTPCQGCHMPPRASGGHTHGFPGGGIPKEAGLVPQEFPAGLDVTTEVRDGALVLGLVNARAGHRVPTGDPERFYLVRARFLDAAGAEVGVHEERIGQVWEWWPTPRQLSDNRLAPQERRDVSVPIPAAAAEIELVVTRHRMTEEARDYHHLDGYPIAAELLRRRIPAR